MPANPVEFPLGAPSISGTTYSVDLLLNEPTRISNIINDLSLYAKYGNFYSTQVFTDSGTVEGGALVYTQLTTNDLWLTREVQNVEPGAEFPIVTSDRQAPLVATLEKFGGKFDITREARRRNDMSVFELQSIKLANNMVRQLNTKALAVLNASITATANTTAGHSWGAVVTGGSSQTNNTAWPAADIAAAQLVADQQQLGVQFDTWLINPAEANKFKVIYGQNWRDVLSDWNVEFFVSNSITAGTAFALERGQVGQIRHEFGLQTETWYEEKTQKNWVQVSNDALFAVTNPYSVLKVTGIA